MRKKIIRREVVYSSSYSKCMGLCATCTYCTAEWLRNGFLPYKHQQSSTVGAFYDFFTHDIIYAFCTESVY